MRSTTSAGARSARHPPAPALLNVEGLEGQRGERTLFKGLALNLQAGEVVWLRGRNGRGKTTLLRILAGLTSPAAGQILLQGQPLRGTEWRTDLTYVAQNLRDASEFSHLPAFENCAG